MKYILSAILLATAITGHSQQVFHDKDAQVRQVGSFTSVEVSSAIELQLTQGSEDAVAVSANGKENIDAIKTEVRDGHLKIYYEQKNWFKNKGGARVYVSVKTLNGLGASGASAIVVNGLVTSDALSIKMSGASDLKGEIKAGALDVQLSGASDMSLKGSAANVKIHVSGASHLKGYDFIADNCLIQASGASDVELTANKVISAEASGASNVFYKGNGQEGQLKSSGASSITRKS